MGEKIKKYHITDDGDVYRVNDDGSFTSMGNAEKMSESNSEESFNFNKNHTSSNENPIKPFSHDNSRKRSWVSGIIILMIIVGCILYFIKTSNPEDNLSQPDTDTIAADYNNTILVTESTVENISPEAHKSSQKNKSQSTQDLVPAVTNKAVPKISSKEPIVQEITGHGQKSAVEPVHRTETQNTNSIDPNKVYYAVEVQAEFPGGDRARLQWLRDHIVWPRDVNGTQLQGDVELEFIIERDGSVSNVKVTYSENPELNSAAITLISSMPKWSPAMVKNQPVRSPMGITLFF